jgi:hypothetical protein
MSSRSRRRARQLLYEHRSEPLISRGAFAQRMLNHGGLAVALVAVALALGMIGYRATEGLGWLDAFLNAAMILSGMGEVAPLATSAGKLFAGLYALFSGLVILVSAGILGAPLVHRLLHRLHFEDDAGDSGR